MSTQTPNPNASPAPNVDNAPRFIPPPPQTPRANRIPPPSAAFQGVSWFAVALGGLTFAYNAWNAPLLDVNGRYLLVIAFLALLAGAVTISKVVRDKEENIPVTSTFIGAAWAGVLVPFFIMAYWMLFDARIPAASLATIAMSACLCLFGAIAVSKNVRDLECAKK